MIGKALLHYFRVLLGADDAKTQTTLAERNLIKSFLPGLKRIVEVGVFEGFTTRFLSLHADDDAHIYGIDPFFTGRLGISWGELIVHHILRDQLENGRVQLVKKMSAQTGDDIPAPVDLIFIDGDHSAEGIRQDWAFFSERVVTGGIIALHDTILTSDKPEGYSLGSIEYFNSHIRHDPFFETIAQQDSLSILRKL